VLQIGAGGYTGERSVAIVAVERVRSGVANEEIVEAVLAVAGDGNAEAATEASAASSGIRGYILEGFAAVVVEHAVVEIRSGFGELGKLGAVGKKQAHVPDKGLLDDRGHGGMAKKSISPESQDFTVNPEPGISSFND
jgi:hypothetical protein